MAAYVFRFWVVLVLCALPASGRAADDLDRAIELTLEMKYPEALKLANQALKASSSGPKELAKAYEIQGMSLASLGKTKAAVQSFRRLLAIDPGFRFGENISPKIAEPFDQALKESKNQKKIFLAHTAPEKEVAVKKLALKASLEADPLTMVKKIRMRYQVDGGKQKRKTKRIKGPGTVKMKFSKKLKAKEIRYWFEAINRHGGVLARAGTEKEPFAVKIQPPKPPVVAVSPVVKKKLEPEPPVPPPPVLPPEKKPPEDDEAGAWYEQWWLWTGVGVLVTGGIVAAVLAADLGEPSGQPNYDVYIK
jgi:hypothetical protein